MAGFTSDPFTTIPDAALEADARQSAADDWASKQRANVAQMWADNARAEAQQLFGGLGSLVGQAGEAIGGAAGQVGQAAGNALGAVSQASDVLTAKPLREGIVGGIGDIVRSAPAAQLVAPPTGEEQAQQVQTSPGASLIAGTLNRYVPAENQQQQEEINRLALAGGGLAMGMSGEPINPTSAAGTVGRLAESANPANRTLGAMYDQAGKLSQAPGLRERLNGLSTWLTRQATDRQVDLARFQEQAARAKGAPLNADEMAYELSRLNPDMAAQVHIQEGLKPAIQAVGQDRDWLSAYLTHMDNIDVAKAMGQKAENAALEAEARTPSSVLDLRRETARGRMLGMHAANAEEAQGAEQLLTGEYPGGAGQVNALNQRVQQSAANSQRLQTQAARDTVRSATKQALNAIETGKQVEANRQFSGGLKAADSARAIQDMQQELGPQRFAQVQQAAQQVNAFGRQLLQRKVDSGIITQDLANELTSRYPNYVPTRILDYLKDPTRIATGKSLSLRDKGLRQNTLEGTTRAREDPLASMVRLAYDTEAAARKNEAFNAVVKLRDMIPGMDQTVRQVPTSYTPKVGETTLTGFVKGVRQNYAVPKELEAAVKQEGVAPIPGLSTAMNLYKSLLTSRNPVFLASNALNDAGTYLVRESSRMGGPQNLPKVVSELVRAYGDAFRGVLSGEFKGNTAEFLKQGGGQFGYFQGTPGQARQTVAELAKRNALDISDRSQLLDFLKGLATLRPVETLGERIELAPRVAAYNLAKGRGENSVQATIRGRTVTMDFGQGGQVSKIVNQFVPFFNVGVQAMAQPARAVRENPRGFVSTAIGLLAAPTVAAEAWNRSDPQRAKDYADVPDYVKDQGVVIMLPGQAPVDAQGNRRPQFVLLKLREFAPFAVMTRRAAEASVGDNARGWDNLLLGAASGISPIQGSNTADSLLSFLPPGINTGAQLALNKDTFRDSMIATKRNDEQATAASKAIAGAVGQRPSQVEFALRDLTGGPGAGVLAASDLATGNQRDTGLSGVPLVGGFAGRLVKGSIGQGLDEARGATLAPDLANSLKTAGVAASVNPVGSTINGIPLTMAEETTYQQLTNQFLDQGLRKVMASASWAGYSAANRQKVVTNLQDNARARASQMVLQGIGSEEARRRKRTGSAGGGG